MNLKLGRVRGINCYIDIKKMEDISGLGKLSEVLAGGIGRLSKGYFAEKDINSDMKRIQGEAVADTAAMKIRVQAIEEATGQKVRVAYVDGEYQITPINPQEAPLPSLDLEGRTQDRLTYQNARKQERIENVTSFAANELKDAENVDPTPLDEDWISKFFTIIEDVSTHDMQRLWAKILAGEIKKTGSYSFRTVEVVRGLTKEDAATFTKFANLTTLVNNRMGFCAWSESFQHLGYTMEELSLMKEAGLVHVLATNVTISHHTIEPNFVIDDTYLFVKNIPSFQPYILHFHFFTKAGTELLRLVPSTKPKGYVEVFAETLKSDFNHVYSAPVLSISPRGVEYGKITRLY